MNLPETLTKSNVKAKNKLLNDTCVIKPFTLKYTFLPDGMH